MLILLFLSYIKDKTWHLKISFAFDDYHVHPKDSQLVNDVNVLSKSVVNPKTTSQNITHINVNHY